MEGKRKKFGDLVVYKKSFSFCLQASASLSICYIILLAIPRGENLIRIGILKVSVGSFSISLGINFSFSYFSLFFVLMKQVFQFYWEPQFYSIDLFVNGLRSADICEKFL